VRKSYWYIFWMNVSHFKLTHDTICSVNEIVSFDNRSLVTQFITVDHNDRRRTDPYCEYLSIFFGQFNECKDRWWVIVRTSEYYTLIIQKIFFELIKILLFLRILILLTQWISNNGQRKRSSGIWLNFSHIIN